MEKKTKGQYATSDQHKESTEVRQVRDCQDVQKLIDFLNDASPFSGNQQVRSITTGMVASDNVNTDRAKDIGQKILDAMNERNVIEISFLLSPKLTQLNGDGRIAKMHCIPYWQTFLQLLSNF